MSTYYVDKDTGDNGNTGGSGDPWETISYGVSQLSSGDTLRIVKAASAYGESPSFSNDHSANRITVRADDLNDRPVVTNSSAWSFSNTGGWNFSGITFDSFTSQGVTIGVLGGSKGHNLTFSNCTWKHSNRKAVRMLHAEDILFEDCHIRDIRSRVAGDDLTGMSLAINATGTGLTWQRCVFEDIGSDGIILNSYCIATDVLIEDCVFFVNRPYGTGGTSLYNGDTTTWQDFSTNVSENGIDIKGWGQTLENIVIRRCAAFGFDDTVAGQDCSGSLGTAILAHNDAVDIVYDNLLVYDSRRGLRFSNGSGSTAGGVLTNCFVHQCGFDGYHFRNASSGVTMEDCVSIDSPDVLGMAGSDVVSVQNNMFIDGACDRSTNTNEQNFDYNLWKNVSPPSQWVGANDISESQVSVSAVKTMGGGIEIDHNIGSIALNEHQLKCHPSIADLSTDIDKFMLTGHAVTVTKEDVSPLRFSVDLERS